MSQELNFCKHGIEKKDWIGRCDYIITYWGCPKCHIERIKQQNRDALKLMLELFGMGFVIVGMIFFWMSFLEYGIQWWNSVGAIICTIICCLPKYLDWRDSK